MKEERKKMLNTDEGKLFIFGVALGMIWIFGLFFLTFFKSTFSLKLLSMIATHLISGRAGGISMGLELGLPSWITILNATIIDSLVVLLVYPLFVFSYKNMFKNKFLKGVLDSSILTAQKEQEKISKFGIIGLLLFVWFPLHMTGPLVGAIIGYFIGLKPYLNITIVITGTFLAVVSWVIFLRKMIDVTGAFSFLIPVFVIVIALIGFLVIRYKHRKDAATSNGDNSGSS